MRGEHREGQAIWIVLKCFHVSLQPGFALGVSDKYGYPTSSVGLLVREHSVDELTDEEFAVMHVTLPTSFDGGDIKLGICGRESQVLFGGPTRTQTWISCHAWSAGTASSTLPITEGTRIFLEYSICHNRGVPPIFSRLDPPLTRLQLLLIRWKQDRYRGPQKLIYLLEYMPPTHGEDLQGVDLIYSQALKTLGDVFGFRIGLANVSSRVVAHAAAENGPADISKKIGPLIDWDGVHVTSDLQWDMAGSEIVQPNFWEEIEGRPCWLVEEEVG